MSQHVKCSFCRDLFNAESLSHAETRACFYVCLNCWHRMQEYLTERGFSIVEEGADAETKGLIGEYLRRRREEESK